VALLRALLAAGWIDLTPTEHPVPFVTRAGAEVMRGETAARMLLPVEPRAKKVRSERSSKSEPAVDLDDASRAAFERLRARRAEIARTRGVPAYVVALDRTLVEMAAQRPRTRGELLSVFGMGPSRVEQYGDALLEAMAG
jgi:ATP-dependent DNA helicase RecQ